MSVLCPAQTNSACMLECSPGESFRYEGRIVQQLIRNAGGSGDYKEIPLPALDIWDALLKVLSSVTEIIHAIASAAVSMQGQCWGVPFSGLLSTVHPMYAKACAATYMQGQP